MPEPELHGTGPDAPSEDPPDLVGMELRRRGLVLGGVMARLVARILDVIIVRLGQQLLEWVLPWVMPLSPDLLVSAASIALALLYFALFVAMQRATPGKMLLDLEVTDGSGETLSFSVAATRIVLDIVLGVLTLTVTYWWALFDPNRQTLHDKICGTVVLRKKGS